MMEVIAAARASGEAFTCRSSIARAGSGNPTDQMQLRRQSPVRMPLFAINAPVVGEVSGKTYTNVEMSDLLAELARRLPERRWEKLQTTSLGPGVGAGADPIDAAALYPRWAKFLKPRDILIAETGTASMGLGFALMPRGATFHNQTLWGSIGWATPAAFGAAVAAPAKRVVLITGDGAHQLTVQKIGQFARLGLRPIVFVLNYDGYLIERLLCKEPSISYNDIAPWHYADLPRAFGCNDWMTARVTTCGEFDRALDAGSAAGMRGVLGVR
jgi:indolepyruvate decarboxylase